MPSQSITTTITRFLAALLVLPLLLMAEDDGTGIGWGSIGYSPGLIFYMPGTFDNLPAVYRGQTANDRSVYPKMMALNGISGVAQFVGQWRLGAMIDVGSADFSASSNDTSFFGKTTLSSAGIILEYVIPLDDATRMYVSLNGGLSIFRTSYELIKTSPDWDSVFQGQSVALSQNGLVSEPQFFFRAGLGTEFAILETIILRLESGIQITRFSGSRWQLDQSIPLADGKDLSLNAPYIKMMIGLGQ